jgi:hypothetical protein
MGWLGLETWVAGLKHRLDGDLVRQGNPQARPPLGAFGKWRAKIGGKPLSSATALDLSPWT